MLFRHVVVNRRLIPEAFLPKAVSYFSIIMAEKLIPAGNHIYIVGLAFRTLLVQELVDRFIKRLVPDQNIHNDKERLPQIWRSSFAAPIGLPGYIAGIVFSRINTRIGNNRIMLRETTNISDLCHQLGSGGTPNAIHSHDSLVFRQIGSQPIHFSSIGFHSTRNSVQLLNSFLNHHLGDVRFRKESDGILCVTIQFSGFFFTEIVIVLLAELQIALCESFLANFADAINMPEGTYIVNPLLTAVGTGGAGKKLPDSRISLFQ